MPATSDSSFEPCVSTELAPSLRGEVSIFIAEDEDIVRYVAERALRKCGYRVLAARNGSEALALQENLSEPIDLLLTDVVMPGMNGRQLAQALLEKRPGLAVLYMSGHSEDIMTHQGILGTNVAFIEKSFTSRVLCEKVRAVLDEARGRSGLPAE
jgi:CheY-like chemotaxis protein